MTFKNSLQNRALSIFLCIAVLMTCLPMSMFAFADSTSAIEQISDPSSMDSWRDFFLPKDGNFNTANAGGVWTDKSVFSDIDDASAKELKDVGLDLNDPNSFLVALSAIGSNMHVTGRSEVATDTVLVLDTSGSMEGDAAKAMVAAANASIHSLLNANPENRIGIVFYASNSLTFLELDHYTLREGVTDGKYLTINSGGTRIELDGDVRNSQSTAPSTRRRSVDGGTYTALGLYGAMNILTADSNELDQAKAARKPIVLLMTDGVPTYMSSNFTAPSTNNRDMGTGNSSGTDVPEVFVTELTAAYTKAKITEKYGDAYDCLFYTVGMTGGDSSPYAECILDPENKNPEAVDTLWQNYLDANVGDDVVIASHTEEEWDWDKFEWVETTVIDAQVEKVSTPLEEYYVDGYYAATSINDLQAAFEKVLADIALKTTYYPTLVQNGDAELSGYVSFVDKIGSYMNVTDVKGLIIDNKLYTGSKLASALETGLGTASNPTSLGDELVWSIQARLGLSTPQQARDIISLAWQNGQMYYNSDTDFSNYFGWYSNAAGEYLGFWYDGGTAPSYTDETDKPVYINKSYMYLGELAENIGDTDASMLYSTIRVRENIETGEIEVNFAVPASLIPTILYSVELGNNGEVESVDVNEATPIRLVYEAALDSSINEWNITELVSSEYINATGENTGNTPNINDDGSINFFTNKFDADLREGYGLANTYSYFRPSYENDRHYYQNDTYIYTKGSGDSYTLYEGAKPEAEDGNAYYHRTTVYAKTGTDTYEIQYQYDPLRDEVLPAADEDTENGGWYIPKGYIRRDYEGYHTLKTESGENPTNSLPYAASPYQDYSAGNANSSAEGHYSVVGTTLGNNGRITITPQTGIKLAKALEDGVTASEDKEFTFTLTGSNNEGVKKYPTYMPDSDTANSEITFENGVATVTLKAGEAIYIGGMTDGEVITVTEKLDLEYELKALSVNGTAIADSKAQLTVADSKIQSAEFVNGYRGTGSFTVTKHVEHPYTNYTIPTDKTFPITVKLTFNDEPLADMSFNDGQYNTDKNGELAFNLAHGEQREIDGIPSGTKVTVIEDLGTSYPGFTASYLDNGTAGDGVVTVEADKTNYVVVLNKYIPEEYTPININVSGEKHFGRAWAEGDSFKFVLEKLVNGVWTEMQTVTIDGDDYTVGSTDDVPFIFENAFEGESYTDVGTYSYRIHESGGTIPGVQYDTRYHSFSVTVVDPDMNGKLEISEVTGIANVEVTANANSYDVKAKFTNEYETEQAKATIEIDKTVSNPSNSPNATLDGFEFTVTPVVGGELQTAEAITSTATTINGITKIDLTFNEAGTYEYEVQEIADTKEGEAWKYNTDPIRVTVKVEDNTSTAELVAKAYIGTEEPANATSTVVVPVENLYDPDDTVIVLTDTDARLDFAHKQLNGRAMDDDEFTFYIYDSAKKLVAEGKNKAAADGAKADIVFDKNLYFDTVGIYNYTVYEDTTPETAIPGVTKDTNVYLVAVTVVDNGGQLEASIKVANTIDDTITFVNSYSAASVKNTIKATKKLENKPLTNNEFHFTMVECDKNGNAKEGATVINADNTQTGEVIFSEQTYTKAGTYYYLISENIPTGDKLGVAYDTTQYIATVVVEDNLKGNLVVKAPTYSIKGGGTADNGLLFTNEYTAKPTDITFDGVKQFTGMVLGKGAFDFALYESNESWAEVKHLETVSNEAAAVGNSFGTFGFKKLDLTEVKDYYFLVKEVMPSDPNPGISYDSTVFRIKVSVTDNLRGNLVAKTSIVTDKNVPVDNIRFVNSYAVIGTATVTFGGEKTLNGRDMKDDEFTFGLYSADSSYNVDGQSLITNTNKNKRYSIDVKYDKDDIGNTYYYVLREFKKGTTFEGVTYSDVEYKISVKVEDDLRGSVKTTVNVVGDTAIDKLDFTNTYKAKLTDVTFGGSKKLTGMVLGDDAFSFALYESNESWAEVKELQTVKNKAPVGTSEYGEFGFTKLDLTEAKDYYFLIKEVKPLDPNPGIEYDKTVYRIKITVTDDLKGNLVAATKIETADGQPKDDVIFVNNYTVTGKDTVTFSGEKALDGRTMTDGEFTFELYSANSSYAVSGSALKSDTNANKKYSISMEYDKDDIGNTYYYVLREKNFGDTLKGVTYSSKEYNISVKVEDNLRGGVKTITTVVGGTAANALNFSNSYKAAATKTDFSGKKELKGNLKIADARFNFDLYKANSSYSYSGTDLIKSVQNDASGEFSFKDVELKEAKIHYFVIKENSQSAIAGVTYDKSVYEIKVEVKDDGKGNLYVDGTSMKKALGDNRETAAKIEFSNSYKAKDATLNLKGTKKLEGKKLTEGEFAFKLFTAKEDFTVNKEIPASTAFNNADGSITFDALTFSEIGKYYYIIEEDTTVGANRVTFDKVKYYVTVSVTDNTETAKLETKYTVQKAVDSDKLDEEIIFSNVYTPKPNDITVSFDVNKTVVNKGSEKLTADGFRFLLENVTTKEKLNADTDKDGKASFKLTFTENDIGKSYEYKLTEVNDGKAYVKYSTEEYTVKVTISLNDKNELVATIVQNDKEVENIACDFVNEYDYTPESPKTGENSKLVLWFALLFVSGFGLVGISAYNRRKKEN